MFYLHLFAIEKYMLIVNKEENLIDWPDS